MRIVRSLITYTDYTVSYKNNKKVGTATITIKGKGDYAGTVTKTFKINPVKTSVKKITAGKKSLKVTVSKKSTQVSGYQIQYSTSKKFKSAKTKTIKSYKTTSATIKSLKAKKTYYVRVRTYKTVNGKKYYFDSNGVMQKGWQEVVKGRRSYFGNDGVMKIKWQVIILSCNIKIETYLKKFSHTIN